MNRLVVNNGARVVNNNGILGNGASSSNNSALVTGSGSLWSNRNDFVVGNSGAGNQLVVSNGATVFANLNRNAIIGGSSPAVSNVVTVTDFGSVWRVGNVLVGSNSPFNRVLVSNGGYLESGYSAIGYESSSSNNEAVITGPGGTLWNSGFLEVGHEGMVTGW